MIRAAVENGTITLALPPLAIMWGLALLVTRRRGGDR